MVAFSSFRICSRQLQNSGYKTHLSLFSAIFLTFHSTTTLYSEPAFVRIAKMKLLTLAFTLLLALAVDARPTGQEASTESEVKHDWNSAVWSNFVKSYVFLEEK
ncbi:Hypothetical protein R9X50_00557400 [Acrodontium crateriforme]|uniref:Uncharacterized protein n=1 Tax=Acrodontium crateriforme TaxID=150365 RepID=A0AAQ3R623_9PEZI|nr:Hypothetical protein R9X50_00557400 [Acrodontium crateriforme]